MPKIEEMWAYIADEGDGDEGVAAFRSADGTWMPMVGADKARIESLRPMARHIAKVSGRELHLVRFFQKEDIDTIEP